jgi:hypothetical protein
MPNLTSPVPAEHPVNSPPIYSFTVSPSPKDFDPREVEAIGTFTVHVPADRTFGQFAADIADQFGFTTPDSFTVPGSSRNFDAKLEIGASGLGAGDSLLAPGYPELVLHLDSITPDAGHPSGAATFDLRGFDAERMEEAEAELYSDPDAEPSFDPVYRAQFQAELTQTSRGKTISLVRDMRWEGRLPLGLVAAAAVDMADGLLPRNSLTLTVLRGLTPDGWLEYAGANRDTWDGVHLDELGVEPYSIPVAVPQPTVDLGAMLESALEPVMHLVRSRPERGGG